VNSHADKDEEHNRPWTSRHLKACYELGAKVFGWAKRNPKLRGARDGHEWVGWGVATAAHPGNRGKAAAARVRVSAEGSAEGSSAAHEVGNGAITVLARLTAAAVGLPAEKVAFRLGDTALPYAPAAGGSQTTASVGSAVQDAGAKVVAELVKLATGQAKSPLFGLAADAVTPRGGRLVSTTDTAKSDGYSDILRRAEKEFVEADGEATPNADGAKATSLSTGAVFAEVRVDADFGTVRATRVVGVFDCGSVLNPKAARSQLLGGVVMGLGAALSEGTPYAPRSGRPLAPDLADYLVPVAADVPAVDVRFIDEPDPLIAPHGGRGVGEVAITGVGAAVANAVFRATGVRVRALPLTPDKLLAAPAFHGER